MPKKRKIHLTCESVLNYQIPDKYKNDLVKIVITGTTSEIQSINKLPHIIELQKEAKVVFKDNPLIIEDIAIDMKRKSFRELIMDCINSKPKMKRLFAELYGNGGLASQ
ncbi:unnamed protein product [marine sediment metagenome]|uniref:Uncharacterized protein n=1 Tax=marine sediment metagenome TaxID=412755 RepID=X0RGC2_9ZZZZ